MDGAATLESPFLRGFDMMGARREDLEGSPAAVPGIIGRFDLDGVSVSYGGETVVSGVSCKLEPRRVTALIGPSGCGKSTLLRCLNRMNDRVKGAVVSGRIALDGDDVNTDGTDPVALRMRVGQVFQQPNPFPLSIYENVAYGLRLRGVRSREHLDEVVETSLTRAALWNEVKDDLHRSAFALSGGQQQRLCIARALATDPEVLLMDEPCSALDPIATRQIEETIDELRSSVTIVIVTHSMQQAARVSDDTLFMLREASDRPATLVEAGPTVKVFSQPEDERTQAYVTGCFG